MSSILIVESNRITAELLASRLRGVDARHRVYTATDTDEALQIARMRRLGLVVLSGPETRDIVDLLSKFERRPSIVLVPDRPGWEGVHEEVDEVIVGAESVDGLAAVLEEMLEHAAPDVGRSGYPAPSLEEAPDSGRITP